MKRQILLTAVMAPAIAAAGLQVEENKGFKLLSTSSISSEINWRMSPHGSEGSRMSHSRGIPSQTRRLICADGLDPKPIDKVKEAV